MAIREGQSVAIHYGSVATEVAVCLKSAGLAVRSDLCTLELTGHVAWLEALLERALGTTVPVGRAENLGGSWCARVSGRSVLVVGTPSAAARWTRLVRAAVVTGSLVAPLDQTGNHIILSLVGPRVPDLLATAGLATDVAAGSTSSCSLAGCRATLVGETAECVLVLLETNSAAAACAALFEAGSDVGLSLVGTDALARLTAVRHRDP
jgi:glycine cleavage system aminomethyltransferase T